MFPQAATYHEGAQEGERKFTPEMKLSGITYRQWLVGEFMKALITNTGSKEGDQILLAAAKKSKVGPAEVILWSAHRWADAVVSYQENEARQL
jgi:hypothetical protein